MRMIQDDRGESLLELLIAIVIMGVALVAIFDGLVTSILVSDHHRKQSTAGAYARDFAEAIEKVTYANCASTSSYASPSGFTVPSGYGKSVVSVKYWTGSVWQTSCTADLGLQQVTVRVSSADGRAAENVTVMLRKPCGSGSSC